MKKCKHWQSRFLLLKSYSLYCFVKFERYIFHSLKTFLRVSYYSIRETKNIKQEGRGNLYFTGSLDLKMSCFEK